MDTENEPLDEKSYLCLKDLFKSENQYYSLPNNEQVQYSAIILLDFFYVEEFENLFDGLDVLYSETYKICSNLNYLNCQLNYRKLNSEEMFYDKSTYLRLPLIINSRSHSGSNYTCYDLGSDIKELHLTLYSILPSIIVLQVQANLLPHVSEKVNNIFYGCPNDTSIAQLEKDRLKEDRSLSNLKKESIYEIKNELKKQIVDFISTFFKGFFFKKSKKYFSIIPSIDVYSLTYPEESKGISKWIHDNPLFFQCFNIFAYNTGYKFEEFLFFRNFDSEEPFTNYSILISREGSEKELNYNHEGSIGFPLPEISFDLLCLHRWLEFTERHMRNFKKSIIKEMGDFTQNELKNLISNRQLITKELFYFERFKIEIEEYNLWFLHKDYEFKSLNDPERCLFEMLLKMIKRDIKSMDAITKVLNNHSINNLNLKNIEYNNKMQDKVLQLTYIVIIFAIIQIIVAIIPIQLTYHTLYLPLESLLIFISIVLLAIFLNDSQH
jgi:hypothetical protein